MNTTCVQPIPPEMTGCSCSRQDSEGAGLATPEPQPVGLPWGRDRFEDLPVKIDPGQMQPLMMMAGLGLICWLLIRGRMRRRRGGELPVALSLKHNANARSSASVFSGTQSLGAPAEVLKWQVELHDLARELKAELDTKLLAVRSMTIQYDQAARRLSDLIRMAEQMQISPHSPFSEARRLSHAGWPPAKIAQALKLPQSDVEHLLDTPSTANLP